MKKNIYGLVDKLSGNFGDLCIVDRDEEFRDGCVSMLKKSDVPDYFLEDLVGFRYGTLVYDCDMAYPKFDIASIPSIIFSGHDLVLLRKKEMEVVLSETVSEDN